MKYLEQYIEEKLKIKVLGHLTTTECPDGDEVGVSLVIDGYEPGIYIWYIDYAKWLEEKITTQKNKKNMTMEDFFEDVMTALENKPENCQEGQFIYNYIQKEYGVANSVRRIDGVDCFYDNSKIEEFIDRAYNYFIGMDTIAKLV